MTDEAEDVPLPAVFIQGVVHRLAVDGQTLILAGIGFIPALQCAIQFNGVGADEHIADDELAGDEKAAVFVATASQAPAGFLTQALDSVGDGVVAAHATQDGAGGQGQNGPEVVPASFGAAGIGNVGEKCGQPFHLSGAQAHARISNRIL